MTTSGRIDPEQLTRNVNELLQELRVLQTGTQILTGFLLTVPFTERFSALTTAQQRVYLAVLCGATVTTGLVLAPVAFHRLLFRHRERLWVVEAGNRTARAGLALLALTSSGVLYLVFDVVAGRAPALVALVVALLFFTVLWVVVPLTKREREPDRPKG